MRELGIDMPEIRLSAAREHIARMKPRPKPAFEQTAVQKPSVFDSTTIADVLRRVGFGADIPSNPKRLMKCPLHEDDTASMRIFDGGYRCFGCGAKGGVAELVVALGYARSKAEAAKWLESRGA